MVSGDSSSTEVVPRGILRQKGISGGVLRVEVFLVKSEGKKGSGGFLRAEGAFWGFFTVEGGFWWNPEGRRGFQGNSEGRRGFLVES